MNYHKKMKKKHHFYKYIDKFTHKSRTWKFPIFRLFLFLSISSFILYFCTRIDVRSNEGSITNYSSNLPSISNPSYEPYIQFFSYIVKPGDTFAGILSRFNIPERLAVTYYSSLKSVGFHTLFPGDSMVITKDRNKNLKTCSLLSRLTHWYHLYNNDTTLHIEKKPIEVTCYRCVLKGTLETSLSEDMFKYGVGDALVIKFADIFAWDINFFMDPRKGDKFEAVFEKKYREGTFTGYGPILAAKYIGREKTFYAVGLKNAKGSLDYYDLNGKSVQKQFLKAPLRFNRISSRFSYRRKHPILGIYRPHLGIDYAAPRGTAVYSSADGTVTFAGVKGGYGKHIRISHGASYQTYYGHLNRICRGIRRGVRVKQGQFIGTVGSTGLATGPHLDYRMKTGSRFVNPQKISVPSKESVSEEDIDRFERVKQGYLYTLETRFNKEGYFVLDIKKPQSHESIVLKTTPITKVNDGNTPGS